MFRAILLLQRERLKEMWLKKVAKTKKKHTSIDFSIYDFYDFFTILIYTLTSLLQSFTHNASSSSATFSYHLVVRFLLHLILRHCHYSFLSLNCGLIQRAIMCELSVCKLKRYFAPFFVNTHEQLISKSLLQKKRENQEKTYFYRLFLHLQFFYDFLRFLIQHTKWSQKHKRTHKRCV